MAGFSKSRDGPCWSCFFHGNGKEITGLEELCLLTALLGFNPYPEIPLALWSKNGVKTENCRAWPYWQLCNFFNFFFFFSPRKRVYIPSLQPHQVEKVARSPQGAGSPMCHCPAGVTLGTSWSCVRKNALTYKHAKIWDLLWFHYISFLFLGSCGAPTGSSWP